MLQRVSIRTKEYRLQEIRGKAIQEKLITTCFQLSRLQASAGALLGLNVRCGACLVSRRIDFIHVGASERSFRGTACNFWGWMLWYVKHYLLLPLVLHVRILPFIIFFKFIVSFLLARSINSHVPQTFSLVFELCFGVAFTLFASWNAWTSADATIKHVPCNKFPCICLTAPGGLH